MSDVDRREALLHGRLDDALDAGERAELDRLLAGDADARARAEELNALSRAIDSLGPVEPPADMVRSVLDQIFHAAPATGAAGRSASTAGPRAVGAPPTNVHDIDTAIHGGLEMRTKVLIGLAAAAAVVLAVFVVKGFPPGFDGTEGAIGAAKRYQAGQITASDVKLGDEATQQFLQSETFDRILKDDATRKLFSDAQFRNMLGNAQMRGLIGSKELKGLLDSSALADAKVRGALAREDVAGLMKSQALDAAFANENFLKALSAVEVRGGLAKGELKGLTDNAALKGSLMDDAAFSANLLKLRQMDTMLTSDAFLKALSSLELRMALFSGEAQQLFGDAAFLSALDNAAFRQLLGDANLRGLLGVRGLSQALADQNFARMVADGSLQGALQAGALQQALSSPGLSQALTSPRFSEAMRTQ
jgi:hypothetical protein